MSIMEKQVIETWRGWQGHFCCACLFHLNTLLDLDGFKIVVSTVGNYHRYDRPDGPAETIGLDRFWETMAFESSYDKFDDMDVSRQLYFDSEWEWASIDDELLAQAGHYKTVAEIKAKMLSGEITKDSWKKSEYGGYEFQRSSDAS